MKKNLLIVFVKNILLGKVKTRLAKTIGDQNAFEVYKYLVEITERETNKLENCDVHIYFSDVIIESKWLGKSKFVQAGDDLGQRMKNAFENGFENKYTHIIGIGSDLPDLNARIISQAFDHLEQSETVFGPAEDGGYYLLGMNKLYHCIFENKAWSTENLLNSTQLELNELGIKIVLLPTLNDIDTLEDLKNSTIAHHFNHLIAN